MTRNELNQAKHQSTSTPTNNLTLSKAHGLFLEDNDNIDMKDTYKTINVHPPIDEKDVVNKEYCDNNLLSSNNEIDILSKNITELRKGKFEEVTTDQLSANNNLNEIETNFVHFCNKVSADTISQNNGLKVELDTNKFNQSITNIQLGDACVDRWRGLKENHILMMKIVIKYIIAILLESKLVDNKEQD